MLKISVSIDVPDLAKAEAFYVEVLGCRKVRNQGDDMIVLSTDNAEIYLLLRDDGSLPIRESTTIRSCKRHWTPIHLDFLRNDVKDVADKVKEYGGEHEGGESGEWGAIAYCADPFGNGFCVIKE